MYYARVVFDTAPGNFVNKENETQGFVVFAEKEGKKYFKRVEKRERNHNIFYRVAFFVGEFDQIDEAIHYGRSLFYAVLKYYFWIGCPIDIRPFVDSRLFKDPLLGHFLVDKQHTCETNSLQIIQVETGLNEYYDNLHDWQIIEQIPQSFPIEDFSSNGLEYNSMCANVFSLINLAQNLGDYENSIPVLCTAIEYMANIKISCKEKSREEIIVYDKLIDFVDAMTNIKEDIKKDVIQYLKMGKNIGSRKKCKELIAKYAHRNYKFKHETVEYKPNKIFDYCYNYRSKSEHGSIHEIEDVKYEILQLLKYVVLDVLENILREENPEIKNYFEPKLFQLGCCIR